MGTVLSRPGRWCKLLLLIFCVSLLLNLSLWAETPKKRRKFNNLLWAAEGRCLSCLKSRWCNKMAATLRAGLHERLSTSVYLYICDKCHLACRNNSENFVCFHPYVGAVIIWTATSGQQQMLIPDFKMGGRFIVFTHHSSVAKGYGRALSSTV